MAVLSSSLVKLTPLRGGLCLGVPILLFIITAMFGMVSGQNTDQLGRMFEALLRTVVDVIPKPTEQAEGVGALVRRSIGTRRLPRLDPFLVLDHFSGEWPAGFPDHPHRGFETVTYALQGSVMHEDFTGRKGVLQTGDVQWMTAGRGIVHSEMPGKGTGNTRGLQLWINLKGADKRCEPQYQERQAKDMPTANSSGVSVVVVAGEALGVSSPLVTRTPAYYLVFTLQPHARHSQAVPAGWTTAVYVLEGTISTSSDKKLSAHEMAIFGQSEGAVLLANEHDSLSARCLLIAGQPIGEPVAQHGPFVMNTRAEIEQTIQDYQFGRNGFERAPGWKSKQGTEALRERGRSELR